MKSIISKLFTLNKWECLSCNSLDYSDDVSITKITIKGTKCQNKYLFIAQKSKEIS